MLRKHTSTGQQSHTFVGMAVLALHQPPGTKQLIVCGMNTRPDPEKHARCEALQCQKCHFCLKSFYPSTHSTTILSSLLCKRHLCRCPRISAGARRSKETSERKMSATLRWLRCTVSGPGLAFVCRSLWPTDDKFPHPVQQRRFEDV